MTIRGGARIRVYLLHEAARTVDVPLKSQAGKPKLRKLVGLVVLTTGLIVQFNTSTILTELIPSTRPELKKLYWACLTSEIVAVGGLWFIYLKSRERKKTHDPPPQ